MPGLLPFLIFTHSLGDQRVAALKFGFHPGPASQRLSAQSVARITFPSGSLCLYGQVDGRRQNAHQTHGEGAQESKHSPKPRPFPRHLCWSGPSSLTSLSLFPFQGTQRLAVKAEMKQSATWEKCFIPYGSEGCCGRSHPGGGGLDLGRRSHPGWGWVRSGRVESSRRGGGGLWVGGLDLGGSLCPENPSSSSLPECTSCHAQTFQEKCTRAKK